MAILYKRNKTWWARYTDSEGYPHRESLNTQDRQIAVKRLKERESGGPSNSTKNAATPLSEALAHFLDVVCVEKAPDTVSCYRQKSRHLVRILGPNTPVGAITTRVAMEYRATRYKEGASPHTIHKELVPLRGALDAYKLNARSIVPKSDPKYKPVERVIKDPEQFAAIINNLAPKRRLWVMAGVYLGSRDKELRQGCTWEDTNLGNRIMRIRGTKTDRADRLFPIPEPLIPFLEAVPENQRKGPLLEKWTNRRRGLCHAYWKTLGIKIPNWRKKGPDGKRESEKGLPRLSPNDLRRTFATWMHNNGVDIVILARLMGTSVAMLEKVYARPMDKAYRAAVASMPAFPCTEFVPPRGPNLALNAAPDLS